MVAGDNYFFRWRLSFFRSRAFIIDPTIGSLTPQAAEAVFISLRV
jgi:hypothetical protein